MWLLGFFSTFLGLLIGGIIAWIFNGVQKRLDIVNALCAGLILGLICIEIIPEGLELGGWLINIIGIIVGVILFFVLDHTTQNKKSSIDLYIKTGLILLFSISIHNFIMGVLLGASSNELELSKSLLQALLLHSIPEGIILFTPLIIAKMNFYVLLFFSFISSFSVVLGILLGQAMGMDHHILWALLISFTVGIIYMVTIKEILLETLRNSSVLNMILLVIIGFLLMTLYLKIT